MKKIILILLGTVLSVHVFAQIFGESVKVFDIKFKAKEVNGQPKFLGSEDQYHSEIRKPLIEKGEFDFLNNVGTYRINIITSETRNLFDLSTLNSHFEHLDQIDLEFYENRGFDKMIDRKSDLLKNKLFVEYKNRIISETELSKKKDIVFEDKYRELRKMLIASRYEINLKPFNLSKKTITKFTAELKAKVDDIVIQNNIIAKGDLRAYLRRLADESITLTGVYYNISLDNSYVGMINDYIENNIKVIRKDSKKSGSVFRFAKNLIKVISNKNYVITSSLVAIQLKGNVDKSKVSIDIVSSDLQSKFNIPAAKAKEISASIKVTFEQHQQTRFKSDFNSVFIVRYFSSDEFNELKELSQIE